MMAPNLKTKTLQNFLQSPLQDPNEILTAVEELRQLVAEEKATQKTTFAKPVTLEQAIQRLDAWFDERGREEAMSRFVDQFISSPYREPQVKDIDLGYVAAIDGGVRQAAIECLLKKYRSIRGASHFDRMTRLEEQYRRIEDFEVAEELLIRHAEKHDFEILRRADVPERIVLASDEDLAEWL